MTAVPETLGDLTSLVTLELSDNMLDTLPETLDDLPNLTTLELSENHFKVSAQGFGTGGRNEYWRP
ncbi:hypothetical protein GCM10010517_53600 [Streptosporangium fragile]|uniref:Leucine-rich repeat domain-containing protein n=1 Tax=Streptosporangium fragile TaxID=46186 RepID=A0ABN3W5X4_9ACTN